MKKFELSEFKFSVHADEQREQRIMSNYEIERVLNFGSPQVNQENGNIAYIYDHQTVVVNMEDMVIVTVHPGDRPSNPPKLTLIKSKIDTEPAKPEPEQPKEDDGWVDVTEAFMANRYYKKTG